MGISAAPCRRGEKKSMSPSMENTAPARDGSTMYAVYVTNDTSKPVAMTRFVGFEETSTADATFAATNSPQIQASGGVMPATVSYTHLTLPTKRIV